MKLRNFVFIFVLIVVFVGTLMNPRFFKIPDILKSFFKFNAITIPPFGMFFFSEHFVDSTINHELVHWQQWQRMGTFGFYLNYLIGFLKYGYRNNPMEVEAYGSQA